MSKIVLVTGGVRSGKSTFAEELVLPYDSVSYIATGVVSQPDEEFKERIRLHQERRPSTWGTLESFKNLDKHVSNSPYQYFLLDCMTMFTTNLMFDIVAEKYPEKINLEDTNFLTKVEQSHIVQQIEQELRDLLRAVRQNNKQLVIVTNEIGLGVVPSTKLGRYFRDLLGKMNQFLAKESDEVYFVISGLPQKIK